MYENILTIQDISRNQGHNHWILMLLLGGLCLSPLGCGTGVLINEYCNLGHQCENDFFVGDGLDSIEVCKIHIENDHKRLDTNSEAICGDIKIAHIDYMTCIVRTSEEANSEADRCDGLDLIFSPCHDERATWSNLVAESGRECHE